MTPILQTTVTSLSGLGSFLAYFITSGVLLVIFGFIYVRITPYKEITLIRQGNTAAAIAFGGAVLGYAIPLASVVSQSVSFVDMVVWACVALVVQLCAYVVVRLTLPHIKDDIPANKLAQGIFLGVISLAAGILDAACMTY